MLVKELRVVGLSSEPRLFRLFGMSSSPHTPPAPILPRDTLTPDLGWPPTGSPSN